MTKSPFFWGAGLACAMGGAVAGSALGSTPILDRPTLTSFYASHADAQAPGAARDTPPDHYPLVTRAGTVPVGELGQRGLYSQARYRTTFAAIGSSEAPYPEDNYSSPLPGREVTPAPAPANDEGRAGGEAVAEAPAAPLRLAGPADVEERDGAKLIDVSTTLAMR